MTSTVIDIRPMTADDYDEVADLWRNTEGIGLDEHVDAREGIAGYLARHPGLSFVARQEGRIVGAVLCGHDGRRGYLHHLAVATARRRKGIGRALVEACLTGLGSAGIPKCNIFLLADNELGKSFWIHNGWNERDDLKVLQKETPS
jgi:N-acetylglutamate synthase